MGLDYFPLDVDVFEDDKLLDVQNEFGPLGEVIYLRILCIIYKNSYYYKFESLNKLAAKLIKSIGGKWVRNKERILDVISLLAECNLLSTELMRSGILTSTGVQRRYLKITGRRRFTKKDYWLISDEEEIELVSEIIDWDSLNNVHNNSVIDDNNDVFAYNNPDNVGNNHIKQSKVNEIKENENERKNEVIKYIDNTSVETVDNWEYSDNKTEYQNDPLEVIADVQYKNKGTIKHLIFRREDADKIRNIFSDVDLKIESERMQNWFDKPEHKNINLTGESLNNFLNRWFANAHLWGGSKAIDADKDFDLDEFFESIIRKKG